MGYVNHIFNQAWSKYDKKKNLSICKWISSFRLSTKSPTLLAVFLCTLSAGTALACSLRLVRFPQESAQITANSIIYKLNSTSNSLKIRYYLKNNYINRQNPSQINARGLSKFFLLRRNCCMFHALYGWNCYFIIYDMIKFNIFLRN